MGFWADRKVKRAHKRAMAQYELAHHDWKRDVEIFNKIRDSFELAAKGEEEPKAPVLELPAAKTVQIEK